MEINNILETEDREVFMTLSQTYQEWKEATKREGLEQGLERGLEQGLERGKLEAKLESIPRLLDFGFKCGTNRSSFGFRLRTGPTSYSRNSMKPHDQFAKNYLEQLLSPLGIVEISKMEIKNILETEDREVFMTLSQTYQNGRKQLNGKDDWKEN
jgi:hypothetical protein